MRQLKNCPVGHFVKYDGILCQVNCFYSNWRGKQCTLIEVKHGSRRMFTPYATEKVVYPGEQATDENGNFWVYRRRDPVEEFNRIWGTR